MFKDLFRSTSCECSTVEYNKEIYSNYPKDFCLFCGCLLITVRLERTNLHSRNVKEIFADKI